MSLPFHLQSFKARMAPLRALKILRAVLDEQGFADVEIEALFAEFSRGVSVEEIVAGRGLPLDVTPLLKSVLGRVQRTVEAYRTNQPPPGAVIRNKAGRKPKTGPVPQRPPSRKS